MKVQIFVDEMTDFSPFQIACMKNLSLRSFLAGGDFNQRLTDYGCSSKEDLNWALRKFDLIEITTNYRQSLKLNFLAHRILNAETNIDTNSKQYEKCASPIWLKNASDLKKISRWIVERIAEIYKHYGIVPSIAILVNSEMEVQPLAVLLEEDGRKYNFSVEACVNGQAVGSEINIRVFDIHHIKGLEFEAVFFVSADRASKDIEIERYLYVGTTRATNYLGITTVGSNLPNILESCLDLFEENFHEY